MGLTKILISQLTNEEFYEAYVEMNIQRQQRQLGPVEFNAVLKECLEKGEIKLSRYLELQTLIQNR